MKSQRRRSSKRQLRATLVARFARRFWAMSMIVALVTVASSSLATKSVPPITAGQPIGSRDYYREFKGGKLVDVWYTQGTHSGYLVIASSPHDGYSGVFGLTDRHVMEGVLLANSHRPSLFDMYAPDIGDILQQYLNSGGTTFDTSLDLRLGQGALFAQIDWFGTNLADAAIFGFADSFQGANSIFCGGSYSSQPGTLFTSGCDDNKVFPVATFAAPTDTVIMPGTPIYANIRSSGKQLTTIASVMRAYYTQNENWPESDPNHTTFTTRYSINRSLFGIKPQYYKVNINVVNGDSGSPICLASTKDANKNPCFALAGNLVSGGELNTDPASGRYGVFQSVSRAIIPALQERLTGGKARLIGVAGSCAATTSSGVTPNGNFDPQYFSTYTPAQVDSVAAAEAKIDAAMSTHIDASYNWDDVVMASNSLIRDEEVIVDPNTLVPYIAVAYDNTTGTGGTGWYNSGDVTGEAIASSVYNATASILDPKSQYANMSVNQWLASQGLDPTTLTAYPAAMNSGYDRTLEPQQQSDGGTYTRSCDFDLTAPLENSAGGLSPITVSITGDGIPGGYWMDYYYDGTYCGSNCSNNGSSPVTSQSFTMTLPNGTHSITATEYGPGPTQICTETVSNVNVGCDFSLVTPMSYSDEGPSPIQVSIQGTANPGAYWMNYYDDGKYCGSNCSNNGSSDTATQNFTMSLPAGTSHTITATEYGPGSTQICTQSASSVTTE